MSVQQAKCSFGGPLYISVDLQNAKDKGKVSRLGMYTGMIKSQTRYYSGEGSGTPLQDSC